MANITLGKCNIWQWHIIRIIFIYKLSFMMRLARFSPSLSALSYISGILVRINGYIPERQTGWRRRMNWARTWTFRIIFHERKTSLWPCHPIQTEHYRNSKWGWHFYLIIQTWTNYYHHYLLTGSCKEILFEPRKWICLEGCWRDRNLPKQSQELN